MRYYLDTEFDETESALTLLSLALRGEDGRELYLVSSDFSSAACNPWVQENVLPHLYAPVPKDYSPMACIMPKNRFAEQIELFLCHDDEPEFWGYYCAYDWFLFCRLWGGMLRMPSRFPKICYDLKQLADVLLPDVNFKDDNPPLQPQHNALADARWNETLFNYVVNTADAQDDDLRGVDVFISVARS